MTIVCVRPSSPIERKVQMIVTAELLVNWLEDIQNEHTLNLMQSINRIIAKKHKR